MISKRMVLVVYMAVMTTTSMAANAAESSTVVQMDVNWSEFLGRHDLVWDRIPNRWECSPFTGNGNVGFLFYQNSSEAKNVISLYPGRHDYYDHRLPHEGEQMLWIYRSRLPLGRFTLESEGDITGVDMRFDLWNAELMGTITTAKGSYALRGITHSTTDVIYFQTAAKGGESVTITWHPEVPFAPVRESLDRGGGPKGDSWDAMRNAPYPLPPEPTWSKADGMQFCFQPLLDQRGETTTGWQLTGDAAGTQLLTASVHHSFPEHNSLATVKQSLLNAKQQLAADTFFGPHQAWWHTYYPQSFLTMNDPEKEAFYWIQMYKLGAAMRENGPILDLMGPWYNKTFWPMVWGDLNVQLIYWTHLTANRLSLGESLPRNLDKYAGNLAKNVPAHWDDSAAIAACFPQDCLAYNRNGVPDMLAWIMNNYWLHLQYTGDRERFRDGLFPLLRKTVNAYRHYLRENPVESDDGKIHIKNSWSPEYPGGRGQDINFTIALLNWSCQTLLDINAEFSLNDPLAKEWQHIVDNLVDYQIDEHGLRIGKDIAFEKPHRHYSHLLGFYPLAVITPETAADAKMLRTSLDHWLKVSIESSIKVGAMPFTGYTATGAASMYATLGDAEKAYYYLDFLIKHKNISPTTMYGEGNGNPVIESPLSFATCIHDMLLQSWGDKIRVFPATPELWGDVAFHDLRTQGAFLVSARKQDGVTQFVTVESLVGSPCVVQTDIPKPIISINGVTAEPGQARKTGKGFYEIALKQGDVVTFTPVPLADTDLSIAPIPVPEEKRGLFGLNEKTERLQGHQYYFNSKVHSSKRVVSKQTVAFTPAQAQFVRIGLTGDGRVLSLAEVEVFEKGVNVALKQATRQSSTVHGGVAERAVDGNTSGSYGDNSVTHTDASENPWWEVDLGRMVDIESLNVYNRQGNADRLDGFTVKLLDAQRKAVFVKKGISGAGITEFANK